MVLLKYYLVFITTLVFIDAAPNNNGERDISVSYQFSSVKNNSRANDILREDEVCKREILSNITKELKMYMDSSVDPCNDFYTYACGNFERIHPIPAERSMFNVDALISDRLGKIYKEFWDDPADATSDVNTAEYKTRELYRLCMDMDSRRERGIQPMLDFFETTLGGWHVFNQTFEEDKFDWLEASAKSCQYFITVFLDVSIRPDIEQSNKNVIVLHEDRSPIPLPRQDILSNSSKVEEFKKLIQDSLVLAGVPSQLASETSEDVVQFSIELRNITMDYDNVKDLKEYYERLTLRELQEKVPDIDWARFFKIIFGRNLSPKQNINIASTEYVYKLPKLLAKTSKKTLANYAAWKLFWVKKNILDDRYDKVDQTGANATVEPNENPGLAKHCRDMAASAISEPIQAVFVRKYFKQTSKKEVTEMTENFRETLRRMISEKDWLDDETKSELLAKLDNMVLLIGYQDEILSDKAMNEKYKNLKLVPGKYFESIIAIDKFKVSKMVRELNKKRDRNEWPSNALVVNAFYSNADNKIVISAGRLIPPYYHVDFPKAINFGAIGMVLGHELTYAFDKSGRNINSEGKLLDAWSNASAASFDELTECFIDQYNQYSLRNTSVRGRVNLDENIADASGIRLAYNAYIDWLERTSQKKELALPGLDMTDKQLFFLAFAHTCCTAYHPESLIHSIKSGRRSPAELRVRIPLSNMVEFSEAFKCPVGSNMNPEKKCVVW